MDLVGFGLSVSVIGAIIVFAGLAMIVGGVVLLKSAGGRKEAALPASPSRADDLPVVLTAAVAAATEQAEQERLIAVLTAAVAAMWTDQESGFVVRRVRRVQTSPAWQRAGREEQIYSRM